MRLELNIERRAVAPPCGVTCRTTFFLPNAIQYPTAGIGIKVGDEGTQAHHDRIGDADTEGRPAGYTAGQYSGAASNATINICSTDEPNNDALL